VRLDCFSIMSGSPVDRSDVQPALPAGCERRASRGASAANPAWSPPDEFGEYRLVRLLGVGAMGQVYLAHDLLLDRPVAVKFVYGAETPAARARIIDEARAIARLAHPNVVAIHRVAEVDGHPYLVSEYVRGRALDELGLPLPWQQVIDIALDLARGLAAAHRRGVLHRDVKPANAILTEEGRAKLLDFGLARVVDRTAEHSGVALLREPSSDRGRYLHCLATVDATPVSCDRAQRDGDRAVRGRDSTLPMPVGDARDFALDAVAAVRTDPSRRMAAGTPLYMAPEIWCGGAATRQTDLYSLGVLLYELLTGATPHRGESIAAIACAVMDLDAPRLLDIAPQVEPALAAIVERLIQRDPGARFATADALLVALEDVVTPTAVVASDGNPYRGLAVFESAHSALFFGRQREIRELVDRVTTGAFVVVGGDSGTGKSSVCRAGVLPWLAGCAGWSCAAMVPGRHPVHSLAVALAAWAATDEAELAVALRDDPDAVARAVRRHLAACEPPAAERGFPRRLLLFVDQLEELLTLAEPEQARVVTTALAVLAVHTSSLHVLATARSDFLTRLAMLPDLGDELASGLYFLRPLTGEHMRDVIVRPAAARGVAYESEALIEALIEQTERAPGGLPLLQFTLAELWDARDASSGVLRAEALGALGGVGGALTRHADRVLAALGRDAEDAARRVLLRLVTAEGTRARRSEAELVTGCGGPDTGHPGSENRVRDAERAALEALVRGRIVVANDTHGGAYELAHEALLTGWSTLLAWRQRGAADRAVRERLEHAAVVWERASRARELLWGPRQLAATRSIDRASLAPREAAFLAASRRAIRSRRIAGAVAVAVLVIGAVIAGLAIRARVRRDLEAVVTDRVRTAATAQDAARQIAAQRDAAQLRAFERFDANRWREGEGAWTEVEALAAREDRQYRVASGDLEIALRLDPARADLRDRFADLTFERLLRAERDRHPDLMDELAVRLAAYDDGHRRAALSADGRIELEVEPRGTTVWSERPGETRQHVGQAPRSALTLPPGSVILSFEAPGRVPARLPVLVARGQTLRLAVVLPAAASAPPGMIYVPPGRFLFGSAGVSELRQGFLNAAPLHEVQTAGFFISRYEVTFAEWIEFLDDLPADERRRRSPGAAGVQTALTLTEIGPRRWRLSLTPSARTYTVQTGQRLHYDGRAKRADQDWTRFPVSAVSYDDAVAYAAWLDRTGRLAGARLCDEYEWERAARGADARAFPGGAALAPDDANIDATYGRDPVAFGPDEVGSHPGARSPVGAEDMAGNVWEMTRSLQTPGAPTFRGGSWYTGDLSAYSANREPGEHTERDVRIGLRLCATPR
jgi:serine/threonine protein kinase/formylglycine-generating enzyme required for sulfatase activity